MATNNIAQQLINLPSNSNPNLISENLRNYKMLDSSLDNIAHVLTKSDEAEKQAQNQRALQELRLNEYYKNNRESQINKIKNINSINILNQYQENIDKLQATYSNDLDDQQKRAKYRQQLEQAIKSKNEALMQYGTAKVADMSLQQTDKEINNLYMSTITKHTYAQLLQKYSNNVTTFGPVEAYTKVHKDFMNILKQQELSDTDKIAFMDAFMQFKKDISADEAVDKINYNKAVTHNTNTTVANTLDTFKKQGIKIDSIYTDSMEYKKDIQKIHDYAIKHNWDTATENKALNYLHYQDQPQDKQNTQDINIYDDKSTPISYTVQNKNITINKLPIKTNNNQTNYIDAIPPKQALDLVGSKHMRDMYNMDNAVNANISPIEFATQVLKIPANYLNKDGEIKSDKVTSIRDSLNSAYSLYRKMYDLGTGKNQMLLIDSNMLDKNSKFIEIPTESNKSIKIPKSEIQSIDINGKPQYVITSNTLSKYGNGSNITDAEHKITIPLTSKVNTTIDLPNTQKVEPAEYSDVLSNSLTKLVIASGTKGKDKTNVTNAILIAKPDKYLSINSDVVDKSYEHFKANYNINISKQEYFNQVFKPAREKAIENGKVYYNMKLIEKSLPGIKVNVPKTINGIGSAHQYELKIEPFKIINNPKNSIKFIRGLNQMASKNGNPINNYRDIVKYAKNEPGKFHDKFYELLRHVGGCNAIGGLSSECKIPYKNLNAIINELRTFNTKDK